MISIGLCSTLDVITFGQNWHHLYSSSTGRKDLSNDTQTIVIGSIEHEISMKMLKMSVKNLEEKFL